MFTERNFFEMLFFRKFCPTLKTFFGQVNGLLAWGASVVRCKKFETPQNVIFTIFKKFKFEKKNFLGPKKIGANLFLNIYIFCKKWVKSVPNLPFTLKKRKFSKKNFSRCRIFEISKMLNFKGLEPFLVNYDPP